MMPPAETLNVKLWRDGAVREVAVKLAEFPTEEQRASNNGGRSDSEPSGISVADLDAQTRQELGLRPGTQGVVVTEVNPSSPAAGSGIRPGDVIQEVNRRPVRNAGEFENAMGKAGKDPLLLVNRHGTTLFIAV